MNIYISKNGKQFGPYSEEQVRSYLATGFFQVDDLAWREGCLDWSALRTIISPLSHPPRSGKKVMLIAIPVCLLVLASIGVYGWNKHRVRVADEGETKQMQVQAMQEFKNVLEIQSKVLDQLLRLNSICEMGTNRLNYSSLLVQVKPEVDSLLRSYPSRADQDFRKYANEALDCYAEAQSDWENAPVTWTEAGGKIKLAALRRDLTAVTIAGIVAFPQMGKELWTEYENGTLTDQKLQAIAKIYEGEKSPPSSE